MDKKFLITNNPESAEILANMGFTMLSKSNNSWVFLNDKTMVFSNLNNVLQTNKISL